MWLSISNLKFSRCTAPECSDDKRPIIIVRQGMTYHYDGKVSPKEAREQLMKELTRE